MSVTWPYAQFTKAAKVAGGPDSFCRDLVNLGFQKGYVAMGKKCVPFVLATGTVAYLWGRFRSIRQKDQALLQFQQEQLLGLIQEYEQTRIHETENSGDETCGESISVPSAPINVPRTKVQYGPVDYRRQLRIVSDYWYTANMNLGERAYDSADATHQHVLEATAASNIRTGMEIAVCCILMLKGVPDIGDMDLCQKISACGGYLEPDLIERMHMTRKLCNKCVHGGDRPCDTRERLTYAAKTLGTLKSYLETYLTCPHVDRGEF